MNHFCANRKKCQRRSTLFGLFFFLCSHCYWNFSRISFFYSNQTTQTEEKMSRKVNILPYQKYRPISSFLQLGQRIEEKKNVTFGIIRIVFVLNGFTYDSSMKFLVWKLNKIHWKWEKSHSPRMMKSHVQMRKNENKRREKRLCK